MGYIYRMLVSARAWATERPFLSGFFSLIFCVALLATGSMHAAVGAVLMAALGGPAVIGLLKTFGVAAILKFALGIKWNGDELIHRLPEWMRPLAGYVAAFAVFVAYGMITGAYAGPDGGAALGSDLAAAGFSGAASSNLHNIISTLFPPKSA